MGYPQETIKQQLDQYFNPRHKSQKQFSLSLDFPFEKSANYKKQRLTGLINPIDPIPLIELLPYR